MLNQLTDATKRESTTLRTPQPASHAFTQIHATWRLTRCSVPQNYYFSTDRSAENATRAVGWEKRTKRDGLTSREKPPQGASEGARGNCIRLLCLWKTRTHCITGTIQLTRPAKQKIDSSRVIFALSRKREMLSNWSTCSIHDDKRKVQLCVSGSAAGFPTDEKSIADDK